MKSLLLMSMLAFYGAGAIAQPSLKLVDPLEPLYPDSNALTQYGGRYEADFPSGTLADVHILLQVPVGDSCSVVAFLRRDTLPASVWSRLIDVPVEQNTGLDSRTEMFTGQHNPYVIRRAPFRIFEAIQPLQTGGFRACTPYTAFRLAIPLEKLQKPGPTTVRITVRGRAWELHGTFVAMIHPVRVPAVQDGHFFYTNWFSLTQMEQQHRLTRWSDEWFAMLDRYARMMAHGRQNCIIVPQELFTFQQGRIALDEEKLGRFVDVFLRHGFRYFESPHLMYRGDKDDWSDSVLTVALTKRRYDTPDGKRDVDTIITLIRDFTERYHVRGGWLQHISDEPAAIQSQCYKEVVAQVRRLSPGSTIMEATNDRDSLAGAVDLWCPTIDDFQDHRDFFQKRQQLGEKVLVYTCLVPGGKWLNRLLDQERLRQVYFGWGAARFGTFGYLHWGLNQYQVPDPFVQSVVHHPSPAATPNNFLPAGDTHILYPGKNGPLSSTRFEAFRIGIEDCELLWMLKQKDPVRMDSVIAKVFRSYTEYSTDIRTYRAARKELLESL
jgi:hypothetical protein